MSFNKIAKKSSIDLDDENDNFNEDVQEDTLPDHSILFCSKATKYRKRKRFFSKSKFEKEPKKSKIEKKTSFQDKTTDEDDGFDDFATGGGYSASDDDDDDENEENGDCLPCDFSFFYQNAEIEDSNHYYDDEISSQQQNEEKKAENNENSETNQPQMENSKEKEDDIQLKDFFDSLQTETTKIPENLFNKIEKTEYTLIDIMFFLLKMMIKHRLSESTIESILELLNLLHPDSGIPKCFKTFKNYLDKMGLRFQKLYVTSKGTISLEKPLNSCSKEIVFFPIIRILKVIEKYSNLQDFIFHSFEEINLRLHLGKWFQDNIKDSYPVALLRSGTDGLQACSSVFDEVWPFIGKFISKIADLPNSISDFFTIASASYTEKPKYVDSLLIPVVEELKYLWFHGFRTFLFLFFFYFIISSLSH